MQFFKFLPLSLVFIFSLNAYGKELITAGEWLSLESKVLGENRPFALYLPPSYKESVAQHYPLMLVLDGDEIRFQGMTGLVGSLSSDNLLSQIPEFIIVAIPNTDRNRDLTPTAVNFSFKGQLLERYEVSGGADKFSDFIEKELITYLNKTYRLNDRRLLVGESFGGLYAAHVLLTSPKLFSDYLITDPTFVWDENYLNRVLKDVLTKHPSIQAKVYLSQANNSHLGDIGLTNFRWGNEFSQKLTDFANKNSHFQFKNQYFEDEVHGTVAMLSWYHGLRFLFREQRETE